MEALKIKYFGSQVFVGGVIIMMLSLTTSCKKFIEVDFPVTSSNGNVVYNTDAQAIGVLTSIYSKISMSNLSNANLLGISLFAGLSADELNLFDLNNNTLRPYYSNDLNKQSQDVNFWSQIYPIVFIANSAIEGLNAATALTPSVKQQLLGEAKFIRAFCYFQLVNLYGDVPLALSTDVKVNSSLTRANKNVVYQQIITDLKDAQSLLNSNYVDGSLQNYSSSPEKVRPTKSAATALLARTYLYTGLWSNAEAEATTVINNTSYSLDTLNGVFLKNSKEAIWQLQPVLDGVYSNTQEGAYFVLPPSGPAFNFPVYLSNTIVNSFEMNDRRRTKWIDSVTVSIGGVQTKFYYPGKYKIGQVIKPVTEYSMVLRLAEQYLIRAEARTQQDNLNDALTDLNIIRTRAGLPSLTISNKANLQAAIAQERKVELFTEWGHRWFDLKRTGTVDVLMNLVTPTKGGTWVTTDQLYPIPQSELDKAPGLEQNLGY
jgi:hypothetical protein